MSNKGSVFLIPIPIADDMSMSTCIPADIVKITQEVDVFFVENIKTTRRYLRKLDRDYPIDDKTFHILNKRSDEMEIAKILAQEKGKTIGVMSEAGCPGIADPGELVVKHAHKLKLKVKPLVGPSSILLALISSGKNGQNFTFNGYLPKERLERIKKIKQLESNARRGVTQLFMETPFRNNHLLEDVLENVDNTMTLCIASNITAGNEIIKTKTISDWKKHVPNLNKKPTIFVL